VLKWIVLSAASLALVIILVPVALLLDYMTNCVGWEVWPAIRRARKAIRTLVRKRVPGVRIHSMGTTHKSADNLRIGIDVATDAEREMLRNDAGLLDEARLALAEAGYPQGSIDRVSISIESQETVDREFDGNWFCARK
jgi:hypothetical protein